MNDQGHPYRFLVRIPLICQTVLRVEVAIVRCENNHCIIQSILPSQFFKYSSTCSIDLCRHTVIVFHHSLMQRIVGISHTPSCPSFILISKEIRHLFPCFLCGGWRNRDRVVFVPLHAGFLWHVLSDIRILCMCCKECYIQEEWLVLGASSKKPQSVSLILLCYMPKLLSNLTVMPTIVLDVEINVFEKREMDPPLSSMSHMISILFQFPIETQFTPIVGHIIQLSLRFWKTTPTTWLCGFMSAHVLSSI
mmetsp:Transcript_28380/g.42831  ORF Transcript_28380/g.42831 Transcript_28380/m.42831 type:complete len:250 (+) Transcript_28380:491-1240(+)